MLILKDRVLYDGTKLYIEFTHKGDIEIYTLVVEDYQGNKTNLYAHDSLNIIDFIFDSVIAELNNMTKQVVDLNYIIKMAYE